jgi:hypothetical protein
MSGRFYPGGVWCNRYCMWCDDVVDLTDGGNDCNGDCRNCEHHDDPREAED